MNGKQLKNSILQLAIQGKLVPQDPNDEPASELLDRIRKEKEQLVKDGKLKKKDLESTPITDEEKPFEIPETWEWCRLGEICLFLSRGKSPKYSDSPNQYPVFAQKCNLKDGGISLEQARFLDPTTIDKWQEIYKLKTDDILVNSTGTGTVCRTRLFHEDYLGQYPFTVPDSHVSVVRTFAEIKSAFYYYIFNSKQIQDYWEERLAGSTNQKELYIGTLQETLIPLPPLFEQHRIVAKIEELMPLVEEYDKAQTKLNDLNAKLPEALKKSILQEAIQGKLVPQDPTDEPASALLAKIRLEKEKLVKEGKLKKKDLETTPISEDEKPFDIPESWEWCRLGEIMDFINGRAYKKEELLAKGKYKVLRVGNFFTNDAWYYSDLELEEAKYCNRGDLLYAWSASFGPHIWNIHYSKENLYREYLFYFLLNDVNIIKQSTTGSTMIHVSMENMMPRLIPLPPLSEQQRIVSKIEELFAKIDKLA